MSVSEIKLDTLPVIEIRFQQLKHTITSMIQEHTAKQDEILINAVEKFCEHDNLTRVITEIANKEIRSALENEVRGFFQYGAGAGFIKEVVDAKLNKMFNTAE